MTARRIKLLLIVVSAALAALVLAAWTQTWFTIPLVDGQLVVADGSIAAPALTALALSQLVLLGAIAIAGPVIRVVLGVVQALVGVTIAWSALLALLGPVTASAAAITAATGIAGETSVAGLVDGPVATSAWPAVALVAGVGLVVVAILVLATARRWPGGTRKYQSTRFEPATGAPIPPSTGDTDTDADAHRVTDWDALTHGDDPTR